MSKRSDLLVACMLGNRWRDSSSVGTTSVAAKSPTLASEPNSRVHLETIWYSIKNMAAGSALNYTTVLQIRGANGTVYSNVEFFVASSTIAQASISNVAFANPKKGTGLAVAFNTAIASVTQSVNITGWIEDTNG